MIPPRILIRRLRFSYPGQPELFHGLDLDVQPGEALGIIGPNGCGKSTLLRLLVGLHDSGVSIHFDDTP
ncbi:MAG TPA: ATP-binding cassette domain-containing protein, partial [Candidatus Sumerlaeota bacterium]|nr:ATP-binding cassette domain-containing protein [Candidatus Sumerlaeota bacterium]